MTLNVSWLVSDWLDSGSLGFQKGTCAGLGRRETGEFGKEVGKRDWNWERLWACGKQKWKAIVFCFVIYTPPFPTWLSFVDIIVSPVNEQTVFSAGQESISRSVCLNSPKNPLCLQPGVCCAADSAESTSSLPQSLLCAFAKPNTPLPTHARRINRSGNVSGVMQKPAS